MTNAPEFDHLTAGMLPQQAQPSPLEIVPQPVDPLVSASRRVNRAFVEAALADDHEAAAYYAQVAEELGNRLARQRHIAQTAARSGFWQRLFKRDVK